MRGDAKSIQCRRASGNLLIQASDQLRVGDAAAGEIGGRALTPSLDLFRDRQRNAARTTRQEVVRRKFVFPGIDPSRRLVARPKGPTLRC